MTDIDRRWTPEERLASLKHRLANVGRTVRDDDAPIPTPTRAALRAIEARRVARIEPHDLNDAALARYARDWTGTVRGDVARAEIARRDAARQANGAPDTFNALAYPAGYTRCTCGACQDLTKRDREVRAARTIVRVCETIRHGNYTSRLTVTGSTLRDAVAASLGVSPYYHPGVHSDDRDVPGHITADLAATGHAEFGWADYDVVA